MKFKNKENEQDIVLYKGLCNRVETLWALINPTQGLKLMELANKDTIKTSSKYDNSQSEDGEYTDTCDQESDTDLEAVNFKDEWESLMSVIPKSIVVVHDASSADNGIPKFNKKSLLARSQGIVIKDSGKDN